MNRLRELVRHFLPEHVRRGQAKRGKHPSEHLQASQEELPEQVLYGREKGGGCRAPKKNDNQQDELC